MAPTAKQSIIVNCQREDSNLLQIVKDYDGLYMFWLRQTAPDAEPDFMGEGEFISFDNHPEFKGIVTSAVCGEVWDLDMLLCLMDEVDPEETAELEALVPAYLESLGVTA